MGIKIAFKKSTSEQTLDKFASDLKDVIGHYMYITSMSMQMLYDTQFGFHFIANNDFDVDLVKILIKKYSVDVLKYVIY